MASFSPAMPDSSTTDGLKREAARAAVAEVTDGMIVGLGTGSTASHALTLLADRVRRGLSVRTVATSRRTAEAAKAAGLVLLDLNDVTEVDICIDGVDEIDPALSAIKGAGGAMLIEKIVATMARRNIAIADASKAVRQLGARPIPIEVLPIATAFVGAQVVRLSASAERRAGTDGPFVTDSGNAILDCAFAEIADSATLATVLSAIPGVLGHGVFPDQIDAAYIAGADGVSLRERPVVAPVPPTRLRAGEA